jgi:predicted GIY-YIG superfamily endonuclease
MEPIILCPLVYVLALEHDKYYVGITYNFNLRIAQHISGSGALWTRLHKPIKVIEIIHMGITSKTENETTLRYKTLYGDDAVRGGSYCKVNVIKKCLID